jgi:hypothetical protein
MPETRVLLFSNTGGLQIRQEQIDFTLPLDL